MGRRDRIFSVYEGGRRSRRRLLRRLRFGAQLAATAIIGGLAAWWLLAYIEGSRHGDADRLANHAPPKIGDDGRSEAARPHLRVIDGDTIEDLSTGVRYRLANIDTPETGERARCAAERAAGDEAKEAARAIVAEAATVDFRPVGRTDSYGRTVAHVRVDGRDLGEILMERNLARRWVGRRAPWCDAAGALIR